MFFLILIFSLSTLQNNITNSAGCLREAPDKDKYTETVSCDILQTDFSKKLNEINEAALLGKVNEDIEKHLKCEEIQHNKNKNISENLHTVFEKRNFETCSDSTTKENTTSSSGFKFSNVLLFSQSGLKVNEVFEMLLGYFIEFNVTENARTKMI